MIEKKAFFAEHDITIKTFGFHLYKVTILKTIFVNFKIGGRLELLRWFVWTFLVKCVLWSEYCF